MYETLRMLGEQHEVDLQREASKFHLAAAVRPARRLPRPTRVRIARRTWAALVRSHLGTLLR